jgi:hypothetical protein
LTAEALAAQAVAIRLLSGVPVVENRYQFGDASLAAFVIGQVASASVGAVIAARRPGHPVGWLLLLFGVAHGTQIAAAVAASASMAGRGVVVSDPAWLAVIADGSALVAATTFAALLIVFPEGRVPIRGWQRWRWWMLAASVPFVVGLAIRPGGLWLVPQIENPLAAPLASAILARFPALPAVITALVAVLALSIVTLFTARARSARGVARQQIKWFALSAVVSVVIFAIATVGTAVGPASASLGELPIAAFLLSGSLMPVAIGIAILRYRLYDIDLLIRRTLIYGVLSLGLGVLYGGLVIALQGLLASSTSGDALPVAVSTLAIAALFQPARRAVQGIVDRRFYRSRYDAARTVEAFSARLRDQVDLDRLTDELRRVTQETVRPTRVSVWLRDEGGVG